MKPTYPQNWKLRELKAPRRLSRLTVRILVINLISVGILSFGVLYLDRYQNSLIRGELDALSRQAGIVSRAIAEFAINQDIFQRPRIDEAHVQQIVRRLSGVLSSQVKIYRSDGRLIADGRVISGTRGLVRIEPLRPPPQGDAVSNLAIEIYRRLINWLPSRSTMPTWEASLRSEGAHEEVKAALLGDEGREVRVTENGGLMLTVALPIQRYKQVLGALTLTVAGDEIDEAVREVRFEILSIFGLSITVTVLLSLYLASSITRPIQKLAASAERVRLNRDRELEITDLSARNDEIGELSRAFRDMTESLRQRLDAIEGFAADVAHEIKNPLTSMRSAAETLERVSDPAAQKRLMDVILDDVARMDRLITDISEASRLDAELFRDEMAELDLAELVRTVTATYTSNELLSGKARLIAEVSGDGTGLFVRGHEGRLARVIRNLVDNAYSFSPQGSVIRLHAWSNDGQIFVAVEDEGPGIPEGKLSSVFDRFYSERPSGEKFGTHSGLGLSISKQIVEAHGGSIRAENRLINGSDRAGARFIVQLPGHPV